MKITATTTPDHQFSVLTCDEAAKIYLLQMAQVTRLSCEESYVKTIPPELRAQLLKEIGKGAEILEWLGANPSASLRISSEEIESAFVAASFGCVYFVAGQMPTALFASIFLELAKITPATISFQVLPPAGEIFGRSEVSKEVWDLYEELRGWKQSGEPRFFILPAYRLWTALHQAPIEAEGLEVFIERLGVSTAVFRTTMNVLASAEIAGFTRAPEKQKNKRVRTATQRTRR